VGAAHAPTESVYGIPGGQGFNVIREGRDSSRKVGAEDRRKIRGRRRAVLAQLAVDKIDARRGDLHESASGPESWNRDVTELEARDVSESAQHLRLHGGRLD